MFWYVLVCFGMFWYVLVCFGMFWYVLELLAKRYTKPHPQILIVPSLCPPFWFVRVTEQKNYTEFL